MNTLPLTIQHIAIKIALPVVVGLTIMFAMVLGEPTGLLFAVAVASFATSMGWGYLNLFQLGDWMESQSAAANGYPPTDKRWFGWHEYGKIVLPMAGPVPILAISETIGLPTDFWWVPVVVVSLMAYGCYHLFTLLNHYEARAR